MSSSQKDQPVITPSITPRYHGAGCALEICILEKHEKSCQAHREPGKTEDSVGEYITISREVFKICDASQPSSPVRMQKNTSNQSTSDNRLCPFCSSCPYHGQQDLIFHPHFQGFISTRPKTLVDVPPTSESIEECLVEKSTEQKQIPEVIPVTATNSLESKTTGKKSSSKTSSGFSDSDSPQRLNYEDSESKTSKLSMDSKKPEKVRSPNRLPDIIESLPSTSKSMEKRPSKNSSTAQEEVPVASSSSTQAVAPLKKSSLKNFPSFSNSESLRQIHLQGNVPKTSKVVVNPRKPEDTESPSTPPDIDTLSVDTWSDTTSEPEIPLFKKPFPEEEYVHSEGSDGNVDSDIPDIRNMPLEGKTGERRRVFKLFRWLSRRDPGRNEETE